LERRTREKAIVGGSAGVEPDNSALIGAESPDAGLIANHGIGHDLVFVAIRFGMDAVALAAIRARSRFRMAMAARIVQKLTSSSIISSIDIMRTVSATDAKQRLAALLDAAQREPVVIRRQKRDVAVIMSAEEYERIRDLNAAEFQRFCDRVAAQAKARGLTKSVLNKMLKD
jgi:prevent-host-death family protein